MNHNIDAGQLSSFRQPLNEKVWLFLDKNLWLLACKGSLYRQLPVELRHDYIQNFILDKLSKFPVEIYNVINNPENWERFDKRSSFNSFPIPEVQKPYIGLTIIVPANEIKYYEFKVSDKKVQEVRNYLYTSVRNYFHRQYSRWIKECSPVATETESSEEILDLLATEYHNIYNNSGEEEMRVNKINQAFDKIMKEFTSEDRTIFLWRAGLVTEKAACLTLGISRPTLYRRHDEFKAKYLPMVNEILED